jgi:zinc transport system substrate-binding protein
MLSATKIAAASATLFLALFLAFAAAARAADEGKKIPVFVSVMPQAFFVEQIGGNRVQVDAMVQPGDNPHTYFPTPKQMTKLSQAKVYFRIGITFEHAFVPKLQSTMPALLLVDTREGIALEKMAAHEDEEEEPGHIHEEELDPHIWLDPLLVKKQGEIIRDTLVRLDPAGRSFYEKNYTAFAAELDALHARLSHALAPYLGKSFFVFHPAFGYFAKRYGLHQIAVETGGKSPSARHLAKLIDLAKQKEVKVLFVQPQFSQKSARTVAQAIGGVVIPLDDLAKDYFTNMNRIAEAMTQAVK